MFKLIGLVAISGENASFERHGKGRLNECKSKQTIFRAKGSQGGRPTGNLIA